MDTITTTQQQTWLTCPVCGGLECLCRPRFFAGQLLTEDDLNRLDRYIVAKHRLHNRYLHGWGVACGLEVLCHPCAGQVTIKAGYALSPCGDDIVVCRDTVLDICELINRCRERSSQPDCDPPRQAGQDNCPDAEETWVLAIRYTETASRGTPALHAPVSAKSCGCGGGGSASGGSCGCGSTGKAVTANGSVTRMVSTEVKRNLTRTGLAQCEPTLTCEGYTFEVYKLPPADAQKADQGALIERYMKCFNGWVRAIQSFPPIPENRAEWRSWCCEWKERLLELLADFPLHECESLTALRNFTCLEPGPNQTQNQYVTTVAQSLALLLQDYLHACFCSVLLPPCPAPVEDGRVPLATITVRRKDCTVLRVCNLSVRKFLTTFPNLQYWLSPLPIARQLRTALERICCRPRRRPQLQAEPALGIAAPIAAPAAANVRWTGRLAAFGRVTPGREGATFSQVVRNAFSKRTRPADAEALLFAGIGITDVDEQGRETPLLSEEELSQPWHFLMANQVLRPLIELQRPAAQADRSLWQTLRDAVAGLAASRAPQAPDLQAQFDELQNTVKQQQKQLDEFKKRLAKK